MPKRSKRFDGAKPTKSSDANDDDFVIPNKKGSGRAYIGDHRNHGDSTAVFHGNQGDNNRRFGNHGDGDVFQNYQILNDANNNVEIRTEPWSPCLDVNANIRIKTEPSSPPRNDTNAIVRIKTEPSSPKSDDSNVDVNTRAEPSSTPTGESPLDSKSKTNASKIQIKVEPRWEEEVETRPVDVQELNTRLVHLLEKPHTGVGVCTGQLDESLPLPEITINGYGLLPLPVNDAVGKSLIPHFEKAPYGLGEETLLDPDYRNSYQIGPEKFSILNANFTDAINGLIPKIAAKLGCPDAQIRAELYKMLLYEKGGFFKPHKDTEKARGMFATLIVQIPSIFTGGQFVVEHKGTKTEFGMAQKGSERFCVYVSHYASCTHELKPIQSGYRVALVYSLCWEGNTVAPNPDSLAISIHDLRDDIFSYMKAKNLSKFCWGLLHSYTDNALQKSDFRALKGQDMDVYQKLLAVNKELPASEQLEIYLAKAERKFIESGECDGHWCGRCNFESIDCDSEQGPELNSFYPKTETSTALEHVKVEVKEEVINAQNEQTFWGSVEERECSGPTGNEGATREFWYHHRVLVAFPKTYKLRLLILACSNEREYNYGRQITTAPTKSLNLMLDRIEKDEVLTDAVIETLLDYIKSLTGSWHYIGDIALKSNLEVCKKLLARIAECGKCLQSEKEVKCIEECIKKYGFQEMESYVINILKNSPEAFRREWPYRHTLIYIFQLVEQLPVKKIYGEMLCEILSKLDDSQEGCSKIIRFLLQKYPKLMDSKAEFMLKQKIFSDELILREIIPIFVYCKHDSVLLKPMVHKVLDLAMDSRKDLTVRGFNYGIDTIEKLTPVLAQHDDLLQILISKIREKDAKNKPNWSSMENWFNYLLKQETLKPILKAAFVKPIVESLIASVSAETRKKPPNVRELPIANHRPFDSFMNNEDMTEFTMKPGSQRACQRFMSKNKGKLRPYVSLEFSGIRDDAKIVARKLDWFRREQPRMKADLKKLETYNKNVERLRKLREILRWNELGS